MHGLLVLPLLLRPAASHASRERLGAIMRYIEDHDLEARSDLHIISLFNLYDTIEKHTYFKYLFICVEKKQPHPL